MAELFASGRLVDFILVLVACEIVALMFYWRSTRRGLSPGRLLPNILAGTFLLITLRLSLGGIGWMSCCGCLAAAGVAHLVDLRRRWHD